MVLVLMTQFITISSVVQFDSLFASHSSRKERIPGMDKRLCKDNQQGRNNERAFAIHSVSHILTPIFGIYSVASHKHHASLGRWSKSNHNATVRSLCGDIIERSSASL